MYLRRVTIENFRAIKSISLELDAESTVLIGENGSGKTSFFAALECCLGLRNGEPGVVFERRDFRPPPEDPAGGAPDPIRVLLEFAEREPGEWAGYRDLFGPAVCEDEEKRGCIRWKVRAAWDETAGAAEVSSQFLNADDEGISGIAVPTLVAELRRVNPFLVFRGTQRAGPEQPVEAIESAEKLLAAEGRSTSEIEEFTRDIYEKLSRGWELLTPKDMRKARSVAKRIWRRLVYPKPGRRTRSAHYRLPSGGAQSLGPLLVFGALLSARGSFPLDDDVDPILGSEQIGAFLHPSTLGSVRFVLNSIPVQKLLSTYSREIVSAMPLGSLRRMVRRRSGVEVHQFHEERMKKDDLRRLGYHIRSRRGGALFDRCWLLVEGETEHWLMPEMGRLCGYEFDAEGVGVVEFAQCGIAPILELARDLGISWHVMVDGDDAGDYYIQSVRPYLEGMEREEHVTQLPHGDVEHYLWRSGYSDIYVRAARLGKKGGGRGPADAVINRAVNARSKPYLAISVVEACARDGSPGVPEELRRTVETVVRLARAN